ncbi:MAG: hypothetical protein JWN14_4197 [Chthonomonadales bacterium]|nr:hypothetical protein [Chthonomonadales bacterium]
MKQRSLPTKENSTFADTPNPVLVEIGRNHAISLTPRPPTAVVEQPRKRLRYLIHKNQKRVARAAWCAPVFYGLILLTCLITGMDELTSLSFLPILLSVFGILGVLFWSDARFLKQCRPICREVILQDDVHNVGLLVDALTMRYENINQTVMDALIELLPRLQANDADLLNAEQRARLSSILSKSNIAKRSVTDHRASTQAIYSRLISFRVAILQAFEHVGDSSALPIVEKLTRQEAKTVEQRRIQEAAQECLQALRLRVQQERDPKTLLRAAGSANTETETLLRAATNTQETPPEQLLRPGSPSP